MTDHIIQEPMNYSEGLRILQTTDPAHADTFNPLFERLINNDAFLNAFITQLQQNMAENIESGVQSGLNVVESTTSYMDVNVQAGIIYMPDKKRFSFDVVTTLTITAADVTNPRKDIIYVSSAGLITYLAGTPDVTPVEPDLPASAVKLCVVDVPANATEIGESQLTDSRVLKDNIANLRESFVAHQANDTLHVTQEFKDQLSSGSSILQREILRIKMRQTGLNLDPNAWSDTIEDITGINTDISSGYIFDATNKSLKVNTNQITQDVTIAGGNAIFPTHTVAQKFTATAGMHGKNKVKVSLKSGGIVGIPPLATIKIFSDNADNVGTDISLIAMTNVVWDAIQGNYISGQITINTTFVEGSAYWIVVSVNSGDTNNMIRWASSNTNQYNGGYFAESNDSGASWAKYANIDAGFKIDINEASVIYWNPQTSEGTFTKAVVEALANLGTGSITYEISRDGGTNFTPCNIDTVTDISTQPSGTSIVLKAIITGNAELLAVAWGGSV